ncbi:hypothetical protein MO973_44375 [Paenibacillus sp. TRM 82003]|nr:hypothetical protein [Paenibacillus sp. TRM 82003]
MQEPTIKMLFPNPRSAYGAFDMLQELGYDPEIAGEGDQPLLAIHIEKHDVQSALEISQAYGGELMTGESRPARGSDFGEFDIPAHTVTEDFPEGYVNGGSEAFLEDEYAAVREGYRDSIY